MYIDMSMHIIFQSQQFDYVSKERINELYFCLQNWWGYNLRKVQLITVTTQTHA